MDQITWTRLYDLETVLRRHVLGVQIYDTSHLNKFRIVFGWDGLRVGLFKRADPPLLKPNEIKEAIDGFFAAIVTAFETLKLPVHEVRALVPPV